MFSITITRQRIVSESKVICKVLKYHLVSYGFLSKQQIQHLALHKLHNCSFPIVMADVRIELPTGCRKGVGEEICFMKGKYVLLIDFFFFLFIWLVSFLQSIYFHQYLQFLILFWYCCRCFFASLFSRSSQFFMRVSFASSKSCNFYVLIVCPSFSVG